MQQSCTIKLPKNTHYTTCPMHAFHMVFLRTWRYLAKIRYLTRQTIYIFQCKLHITFVFGGQKMENVIG